MLPFLKKDRAQTGVSVEYRKSDIKPENENGSDGLEACAEDMIKASASGDKKAFSKALRAAFEILDSEPHVEGEHLDEEV